MGESVLDNANLPILRLSRQLQFYLTAYYLIYIVLDFNFHSYIAIEAKNNLRRLSIHNILRP